MIIVTGGAGMIGSNIIHGLNAIGRSDIIAVDDLSDGTKYRNLVGAQISDYIDKDSLFQKIDSGSLDQCEVIFHQGACSSTTEWDGKMMMETNFEYSKQLYNWAISRGISYLFASSASVYGNNVIFSENPENECPLNVYAFSKKLFDDYVRTNHKPGLPPVVGLRYFNVYGPREAHKGSMASVAFHLYNQIQRGETLKLFGASDGVGAGQQSRDFIHVDDVVAVNLWSWQARISGIFNCGTGRAQPFMDVANAIISACGSGEIEFIDFPEHLRGRYQNYTQADMSRLVQVGYHDPFITVENGISGYVKFLADIQA
jgi:ADP-L-glycero-D-manno-heptose 6-epimerase